jgi:hypothetical protein
LALLSVAGDSGLPAALTLPLPLTQVIRDYLQLSVVYDYHFKNTKYVLAQMMEGGQRTKGPYQQQYQDLTRSKGHGDLCRVFDINAEWYEEHKKSTLGGMLTDTKLQKKKRKAEHQLNKERKEKGREAASKNAESEGAEAAAAAEGPIGDCDGAQDA